MNENFLYYTLLALIAVMSVALLLFATHVYADIAVDGVSAGSVLVS